MSGTPRNFKQNAASSGIDKTAENSMLMDKLQKELINAHFLFPKTCDPKTCEYCDNELRQKHEDEQNAIAAEMRIKFGPNWRVNTGQYSFT